MKPIILPYRGVLPEIHPTAFVAPGASVMGDVVIGEDSNIWFGCVLRGDVVITSYSIHYTKLYETRPAARVASRMQSGMPTPR